jgi:hypothetical protein
MFKPWWRCFLLLKNNARFKNETRNKIFSISEAFTESMLTNPNLSKVRVTVIMLDIEIFFACC